MRQFILLIRRYWNIILFLLLQGICFSMISKSHTMQGNDIVNSSNSISGYVYKKQNDVVYYFQLKRLNDSLLNENARLRNLIAGNSNIDTFRDAIATIPVTAKDTVITTTKDSTGAIKITSTGVTKVVRYASYYYIPARVINNSIANDKQNSITINRGSADGVGKEMAVVTGNGIVGRVENVSEHYATIVSVLSDRKTAAKLSDGTGPYFPIWDGNSPDYLITEKVPSYVKIKRGDSIYTIGSSFYPENILIGTIAKIDTIKASGTKTLKVRLSTNFRKLQYVYVVKNKLSEERNKLEAKSTEKTK
ncbi:rod shape-determining protein MreC [Taibaiella lutea]|uniref:Cell shape-determining protein MreC n=1 Tax=Taibaiella lutea TaxID=2608001 RepID=A0A5M6CS53_9BACT|nr:rod shape-determining protein MreC [Taibaiella lutea]KAA5537220.1 rod shape-determining protein MreC [Taibaiella lutea]